MERNNRNRKTTEKSIPQNQSEIHVMLKKSPEPVQKLQSNIKNTHARSKKPPESCNSNPFYIPDNLRTFNYNRKAIMRRLKPEPFLMSDPKTICDIDDSFYKIVDGRPLRQFSDLNVYMNNIRDIALLRANAAYLNEITIQINNNLSDELQRYEKIDKLYQKTKSNFIEYVKQQYNISNSLQEEAEQKSKELNVTIHQLSKIYFVYIEIRNKVDSFILGFEVLSKYGHFLNSLSPLWWRELYDENFQDNKLLFAKVFSESTSPSISLIQVIKTRESLFKKQLPNIYFERPQQLIQVFDNVRKQCLNYMQIQIYFSRIVRSVLKCRDRIKTILSSEINEVGNFTAFYERQWMEEKEMVYKDKFYRILLTEFKTLYCSFESTRLYTCVQYVHTQLLGGFEDPKDNIVTLANNIESLYIDMTFKFDALDQEIVNKVKRKLFADDIKNMKKAYNAQRSLKEFSILKKSLINSFEPPRYKNNSKK